MQTRCNQDGTKGVISEVLTDEDMAKRFPIENPPREFAVDHTRGLIKRLGVKYAMQIVVRKFIPI